jgi:RNA polymerase sigma-70 factor, ECF subfamily
MITQTQMGQQRRLLGNGYADFSKGLNRYARSRVSDSALAEDLIQGTFLKTWAYLVRGGRIEVMEAFLYHILKALIIDEYRKRKLVSLDLLIEKGFDINFDETNRLGAILDGRQAALLIAQLPVLYRKVMRMRYLEDLSLKEISLKTGQTKNAVAVQTHRGLEKLKALHELRVRTATEHMERVRGVVVGR